MANDFDKRINERIERQNKEEREGKRKKKRGRPYSYTARVIEVNPFE